MKELGRSAPAVEGVRRPGGAVARRRPLTPWSAAMKQHVRPVLAALVLAAAVLAAPPSRATAGPPLALSINGTLDFTLVSSNVVYPVLYEAYDFEGSLG